MPCRVALFPLEEFFYVTLRFFLGTLSTQSIHRSAPTRLPPDLALSSILPFRSAPSFPLPLRPFFPPFFLQGAEENPPTTTHPPNLVRPSIPTPPSRHESLSRPIKQTTVKSVPVSVFVCVSVSTQPSPSAPLVVSPVSLGLVLSSPGSLGSPRPGCSRLLSRNDTDRLLSLPLHPTLRSLELDPAIDDNISTSSTAICWTFMVVCIRP